MERSINIILAICATLVIVTQSSDTIVEVTNKVQHVKDGQKVQVSCKLKNFKILAQSVVFYKIGLGAGESKPSLKVISKGIIIEKDYEDRYSVEGKEVQDGFHFEFIMTIKSIHGGDDGKFICSVVDAKSATVASDTFELVVIRNVTDISLQLGDKSTTTDDNLPVLIRGKFNRIPLTCTVSGGNPAPDVKVTVGKKDITAELVRLSPPIQSVTVVGEAFNGTRLWKFSVRSSKIIKEEYVGKKITCSAITPGSSETIAASATISLNEEPKFKCKKKRVVIGASTVISCLITHNIQPVVQANWVDQATQILIRPNEVKKGFKARLEKVDNKTVRAILEISKLPRKTNLYQIEVKHMSWVVSHKVRVDSLQRKTVDPGEGAGNLVTCTPVVVLAAVILVVRVF